MRTADRISRGFHRLGLIYAAIPVLAGIYDAYESARHFEQQRTIDWLTATGCKVLWLAPASQNTHTYTRVTTIEVKDPIDAIALIGKAATRALTGR